MNAVLKPGIDNSWFFS